MNEIKHENLVAEIGKLYDQVTELQTENKKLWKCVQIAKGAITYHKKDCHIEYGGHTCDCGFDDFDEALEELEGE